MIHLDLKILRGLHAKDAHLLSQLTLAVCLDSLSEDYRARTLAVLAQKLDLKPGQKASSAQGQVEMLKDQVKVFLPNGQKYTLDQIN